MSHEYLAPSSEFFRDYNLPSGFAQVCKSGGCAGGFSAQKGLAGQGINARHARFAEKNIQPRSGCACFAGEPSGATIALGHFFPQILLCCAYYSLPGQAFLRGKSTCIHAFSEKGANFRFAQLSYREPGGGIGGAVVELKIPLIEAPCHCLAKSGHFLRKCRNPCVILPASQPRTTPEALTPSPAIAKTGTAHSGRWLGALERLNLIGSNHCPTMIKGKYLPEYQTWPGSRYLLAILHQWDTLPAIPHKAA